MRDEKIKAASGEVALNTSDKEVTLDGSSNNTSTPKKWERVLAAFVSGKSYNRFESERYLSDHTLHSTVSYIQNLGITIHREFEQVPGYMGLPTRVCRYWLDRSSDNVKRAIAVLPTKMTEVL